jgi:hypothetical protein
MALKDLIGLVGAIPHRLKTFNRCDVEVLVCLWPAQFDVS